VLRGGSGSLRGRFEEVPGKVWGDSGGDWGAPREKIRMNIFSAEKLWGSRGHRAAGPEPDPAPHEAKSWKGSRKPSTEPEEAFSAFYVARGGF